MRDVVKRSKVGNFLQKMKNEYTRTKARAREGAADAQQMPLAAETELFWALCQN